MKSDVRSDNVFQIWYVYVLGKWLLNDKLSCGDTNYADTSIACEYHHLFKYSLCIDETDTCHE